MVTTMLFVPWNRMAHPALAHVGVGTIRRNVRVRNTHCYSCSLVQNIVWGGGGGGCG